MQMEQSQLSEVFAKLTKHAKTLGDEITKKLQVMYRIMKSQLSGEPLIAIPWKVSLLVPIALLYFLFPFDLIPDFIPIIGYMDDIYVIGLIWTTIASFIHLFERAEKYQERIRLLESENQSLRDNLDDDKLCCICLEDPHNTMVKPCKHCCLCEGCAPLVTLCPLCRGPIKKWEKVYIK